MNKKGFALPVTLFLVTLLTVMLASAFTRTATDHLVAGSSAAGVDALAIAQSGLQSYFGQVFEDRPQSGDSIRFNLEGGYAWVNPEVLEVPIDPLDDFRYVIRATGYVINPAEGPDPVAVRNIAQFADWQTPALNAPRAAFIGADSVDIDADLTAAGTVDFTGVDAANPTVCDGIVPGDGYGARLNVVGNQELSNADFTGSPALLTANTHQEVALLTGIDWASIEAGNFDPDYSTFVDVTTWYPSILINGNLTITQPTVDGQGLLIVTGTLSIPSGVTSWQWRGIVLVGEILKVRSRDVTFRGTVITGLDHVYNEGPEEKSEIGDHDPNQALLFQYDSCMVLKTLESLSGFIVLENTWVDNWTY